MRLRTGLVPAVAVFALSAFILPATSTEVRTPDGADVTSAAGVRGPDGADQVKTSAAEARALDGLDVESMSPAGRLARLAATGRLDRAIARARAQQQARSKGAGRTPAAFTGDEGDEEGEGDGPAGGQAELSIAVDSTGQHIVVGCNDTRGFSLNPTSVSGFAYSDDGGATWVDGGQLPVNTGTSTIGTTILPQVFGDPEVKYLGGSNFIYFSIMVKKFSATQAAQTMCFHRSTDNGHTWTGPFEIPSATNPHGLLTAAGAPRDAADKEYADVDPDTGRVIMTWNNFTPVAPGQELSSTFSDNVMDAVPVWSPRVIVSAASGDQNAIIPRFAGAGSNNVYAAWPRTSGPNARVIRVARSTDNGVTWGPSADITGSFFFIDHILGNDRVHMFPGLAVDNSGGAHQGTIYTVHCNNNSHDGSDIALERSTDGGLTFSPSILLNSRPGSDRAQWFPWVTVDKTTGRVHVFYYDQGIAQSGDLTETTHLYSDDGGVTWSKPTPLTDRPFHAGYGNDTGQPNLGDYNQAVAQGGELFAVWAGAPNLVPFTDGQPGSASMTVPDITFKRIANRVGSLRLGAVTAVDANGNGFFDIGESVSLTLPLENYVTNPLSASTVSGISATLSSPTPGVTVVQGASAYPNLAAGGSAANTTPYVIKLAPSYVSGTRIDLVLSVISSDPATTLLYTAAPPTPDVPTTLLSEDFNGIAPGSLPAGWATAHGGGANVVPWTTNSTMFGTSSNAAFHINANDGTGGTGNPTRFERLFSPAFAVPAGADYVTVDMDVAYDTEDDPAFNVLAYDGFLLRVTDLTAGRVLRSVLAEAFAEEFTTGTFAHYPKHFPRNSSAAYFEDMSAWAGFSNGFKHVHLKLPGMAGSTAQLRFEFAQDGSDTCANVRPGHLCGVMFDNLVVKWFKAAALVQTSVVVDPAAGQYSDPVTLKATVSPSSASVGSIAGTVQFSVNGGDVGAPVAVDSSGVATLVYTIPLASGSYPIGAKFVSTNASFLNSSGSSTLTVSREDAVVTPSASNPVAVQVSSPGGTASSVVLQATINEVADGSLGNISLASPVSMALAPVAPGPSLNCAAAVLSGGGVGGTLTATCTFTNVPVNVYDVTITVGGNYYTGSAETVVTVFDPSLGFVTGGGTILRNGVKANFGFNAKYKKNASPQGQFLYIEHRPTGDVVYKGNVMETLAIVGNQAVFTGKGVFNGVGNYRYRATAVDNGEPGSSDQLALQLTDPSGADVPGFTFPLTTLNGGNIQVPQ